MAWKTTGQDKAPFVRLFIQNNVKKLEVDVQRWFDACNNACGLALVWDAPIFRMTATAGNGLLDHIVIGSNGQTVNWADLPVSVANPANRLIQVCENRDGSGATSMTTWEIQGDQPPDNIRKRRGTSVGGTQQCP